jgi:hypothetical protein
LLPFILGLCSISFASLGSFQVEGDHASQQFSCAATPSSGHSAPATAAMNPQNFAQA